MPTPSAADPRHRIDWTSPAAAAGLLVVLALPLYFVKLGGPALVDPDEPYYAVPALEMLKSGTWAVTLFHGQPWFDKPILFYWAVLAAFKAFGVNEWAARVASALSGLGGVIAIVALAPRALRERGAHVLGAVVLATSLEYAFLSRAAVTDMMLTFFLTLGFLAAARWLESGRLPPAAVAGGSFGLATLTKGPVGVLIPVIALTGYGIAMRRREMLRAKPVLAALAGFVATAVPWYVYMVVAHRDLVLKVFLGDENLGRFMKPEHRQFAFFYVAVFLLGMLPWSAALPAGLMRAWRVARRRDEGPGTSPGLAYTGCWFLAVVGLFSLSASKLLTYVLPAFPPAAILVAAYWTEALAKSPAGGRVPAGARVTAWAGAALAAVAGVGMAIAARQPKFTGLGPAIDAVAVVLVVAGVLAAVAVGKGRLGVFAAAQASVTMAIVLTLVTVAWPRLEEAESTRSLIARVRGAGLADQIVAAYRVPDVSLDFYLDRTLPRETDEARLAARVAADPHRLWVMRSEEVDGVAARQGFEVERVDVGSRRWLVRLAPRGTP